MFWIAKILLCATAAMTALGVAGCGASEAPEDVLAVDAAADGSLRFERGTARATPGRIEVQMANPSRIPHAVAVRGPGVEEAGVTVGPDGISRVVTDLAPGRYTLFCPVGGHEAAGMTAELLVEGGRS